MPFDGEMASTVLEIDARQWIIKLHRLLESASLYLGHGFKSIKNENSSRFKKAFF